MRESRVVGFVDPFGMVNIALRGKAKKQGTFSLFVRIPGHEDMTEISVHVREGQTAGQVAGALRRKARRMGASGYEAASTVSP
jgi:hypothetical protein